MKAYFKYAEGFVNINDENLFLTNSGNWSETLEMKEKSAQTIRQNKQKKWRFDFFFFIVLLVLIFSIYGFVKGTVPIAFPIMMGAITVGVYMYFRNETGSAYKIPRSKIKAIEISGSEVKLVFLNAANLEDVETIREVEDKGLGIFEEIRRDNFSK